MSSFEHALAGATGGALAITLTYPLLSLTTNLQTKQTDKEQVRTVKQIFLQLYKEKGFYKGLESCVYGITITNFIYYFFYEYSSKIVLKRKRVGHSKQGKKGFKLNAAESIACGLIAGSITATLANPVWVANTKMTTLSASSQEKPTSTFRVICDIVENEGFMQLFKGLKPALMLVINPIIQYTVFEQLKNGFCVSRDTIPPNMGFVLGAISKFVATGLTYPYITLKTRMHLEDVKETGAEGSNASTTMKDMLLNIIKEEGLLNGLYRGIGIKLTQSVLTAAFLFFFKESILQVIIKLIKWRKTGRLTTKVKTM